MKELNEVRLSGNVGQPSTITKGKHAARFVFSIPESYVNSFGDTIKNVTWVPVNVYESDNVDMDLIRPGAALTIEGKLRSFRVEDQGGNSTLTITIQATKITKAN